jgi:hypothetical protein
MGQRVPCDLVARDSHAAATPPGCAPGAHLSRRVRSWWCTARSTPQCSLAVAHWGSLNKTPTLRPLSRVGDRTLRMRQTLSEGALPSGGPRTPRTEGDPDRGIYYHLPGCALPETPPTLSRPQTRHGFPRSCERHKVCDLQLQDL